MTVQDMVGREIGRRIAAFRKERGLTLTELGERVGLSQEQLSRLENGRRGLRLGTLLRIAEGLGVQPFQFFMTAEDDALPAVSESLRKALRDAGFTTLMEDLAITYHGSPSEYAAIKNLVDILLRSTF